MQSAIGERKIQHNGGHYRHQIGFLRIHRVHQRSHKNKRELIRNPIIKHRMARIKHLTKDQQATILETLPQISPLRRRLHPPEAENP